MKVELSETGILIKSESIVESLALKQLVYNKTSKELGETMTISHPFRFKEEESK